MLTKSKNPELFRAICRQLDVSYSIVDELDSATLDKVQTLDLIALDGTNVTSLDGIEELHNLSEFTIKGYSMDREPLMDWYNEREDLADVARGYFEQNQVADFSPLSKCKKLKDCVIAYQRKLETLDFGKLQNLTSISIYECNELRQISGISASMYSGSLDYIYIILCDRLREMPDATRIFGLLGRGYPTTQIRLPSNYFVNLLQNNPSLRETLETIPHNKINWYEPIDSYSTRQMLIAYDRVAEIVNTVCTPKDNDLQKLSNVYRYFCDNKKYADSDVSEEEKVSNRSILSVLFNDSAVCVGFSNILNMCGAYLGFDMQPCSCRLKNAEDDYYDERGIIYSDHSISKCTFYNKLTGESYEYYFDLTWDLGMEKSEFFMLNRNQIQLYHQLTIDDSINQFSKPAPDVQKDLEERGLLRTTARDYIRFKNSDKTIAQSPNSLSKNKVEKPTNNQQQDYQVVPKTNTTIYRQQLNPDPNNPYYFPTVESSTFAPYPTRTIYPNIQQTQENATDTVPANVPTYDNFLGNQIMDYYHKSKENSPKKPEVVEICSYPVNAYGAPTYSIYPQNTAPKQNNTPNLADKSQEKS